MKKQEENLFKEFETSFSRQHFDKELVSYTFQHPLGKLIDDKIADLNLLEVDLHDVIQRNVFKGIDYYRIVNIAPLWMRTAGHSQEGNWTKMDFERLVAKHDNELTHRFLYYHDCEMLMNAFQNRTSVLCTMLNRVFDTLTPDLKYSMPEYDDVIYSCGATSSDVYVNLNSIIIMLASCFDILTKIAYELQEMPIVEFTIYPKMRSANVLYGQRVSLDKSLQQPDTLFSNNKPVSIQMIEALRNEIIHNGSLDFNYSIYHGAKNGEIEHWIFAPEFNDSGTLVNFKNRKKFYSDYNNTFNVLLPRLVLELIEYFQNTIKMLIEKFDCKATDNPGEVMNHQREITRWTGLVVGDREKATLLDWIKELACTGEEFTKID